MEEEPGTFFLTDFLARHFERLVIEGLGLDRFPQLRDDYFGAYSRLVYLAQTDDAGLDAKAEAAAQRLGLAYRAALHRLRRPRRLSCQNRRCRRGRMGQLTIIYWRDIPSQVIAKAGRKSAKRELSERFIRAIDAAAMRAGASSTDAYLEDWRRVDAGPCGDDLEAAAAEAAEGLEADYDNSRLADARQARRAQGLTWRCR